MTVECPEHGACLCYGVENGKRIYRCELGLVHVTNGRAEYLAITHREYWVEQGGAHEVIPHTSPWQDKEG